MSRFLQCAGHVLVMMGGLPILAAVSFAQTAQITGRVIDAADAVVPGTDITVTSVATGEERSVSTNNVGYYTVPALRPGEYRIDARKEGFRPISRSGVVLEVDQRAELDFTLEVGAVTEVVEVTSAIDRLNTVEASQGQVMDNQRIVELPLNGRNYNDLALLSAGTVQPLSTSRYGTFSSGGMRNTANSFILDGVDNNAVDLVGSQRRAEMVQPSVDAIQEFKVQTNAYSAEYGRAMGAVVNVTLKSGTNTLHGTAFEFLRNENLDAKNFFDPADASKPSFKRNQYGFSIGGPVYLGKVFDGRNRVFFFGDYETTKRRESSTIVSTIPTLRMRTGDFGELPAQKKLTDPDTGQPFPGNVIPPSRLDPVAQTLASLYPDPQTAGLAANYVHQSPDSEDGHRWDTRLDFNLGSRANVFWRLSRQDASSPAILRLPAPAYGGDVFASDTEGWNTAMGWNHVWTPNLIMSVRGGWTYALFNRKPPAETQGELLNRRYGIKGGTDDLPGAFTMMSISGYQNVGVGSFTPLNRDSQNRQLTGDMTWTRGKHTVKFGGSIIAAQNNVFTSSNSIGQYSFNGRFSGDGFSDFLLGQASQYSWNASLKVDLRAMHLGYFLQDDWKVTPRLTLNLGARYEVAQPYLDKHDRMGIFDNWTDRNNPRLIVAGQEGDDRFNRAMIATDTNNIMPRVGFAYKLTDRTVIRAGYGIYRHFIEPGIGEREWLMGNPPLGIAVTLDSSVNEPAVILQNGPPPGALEIENASGLTFSSFQRTGDTPYGQQWNFNIQRDWGLNWMSEVSYSGSRGTHLHDRVEDNFSPPGPGNLNLKRPYQSIKLPGINIVSSPLGPVYGHYFRGNSTYHAMLAKLEGRLRGGTILASYSFSKAIGDTSGAAPSGFVTGVGYQDPRNLSPEKSVANEDVPHRLVLSGVHELPFGKNQRWGARMPAVAEALFGGWSLGSIVVFASGRPYTATVPGNPANIGSIRIVNRPNVVGDVRVGERTLLRDFNVDALVPNRRFEFGNAGRNILRQRSFFNWNFSALKNFQLNERLRLQFRFEAFQFTNTPLFGEAGAAVGTGNFGRITSAGTPRNLQFGLKLIW